MPSSSSLSLSRGSAEFPDPAVSLAGVAVLRSKGIPLKMTEVAKRYLKQLGAPSIDPRDHLSISIVAKQNILLELLALKICEAFSVQEKDPEFTEKYYQLTLHLLEHLDQEAVIQIYSELGSAIEQFSELYQILFYPVEKIPEVMALAKKANGEFVHRARVKLMLGENFDAAKLLEASEGNELQEGVFVVDEARLRELSTTDAKRYAELMQRGTESAAVGIELFSWDFFAHLFFLAKWGGMMALLLEHRDPRSLLEASQCLEEPMDTLFGENRAFERFSSAAISKFLCDKSGDYADLGAYIQERLTKNPRSKMDFIRLKSERSGTLGQGEESRKLNNYLDVELETFVHYPSVDENHQTYLKHTSPANLPILLWLTHKKYREALHAERPKETLQLLGEVFWILCRAKVFKKGNLNIAEMLIQSVWRKKYQEFLIPWKKGSQLLVSAIKERDCIHFGLYFHLFFKGQG